MTASTPPRPGEGGKPVPQRSLLSWFKKRKKNGLHQTTEYWDRELKTSIGDRTDAFLNGDMLVYAQYQVQIDLELARRFQDARIDQLESTLHRINLLVADPVIDKIICQALGEEKAVL